MIKMEILTGNLMSLPSRERGLKYFSVRKSGRAPASLPSRERGLKLHLSIIVILWLGVAPLAGAWIEIKLTVLDHARLTVAPLAGAWIEIFADYAPYTDVKLSLPSRERGLKFFCQIIS